MNKGKVATPDNEVLSLPLWFEDDISFGKQFEYMYLDWLHRPVAWHVWMNVWKCAISSVHIDLWDGDD